MKFAYFNESFGFDFGFSFGLIRDLPAIGPRTGA